MSRPAFDVLIVTWNGREDTLRALDALERERRRTDFSVTVVDNGSGDGTLEEVRRRHPATRVLRLLTNRGFTGGVSAGAAVCESEWIALLNNDAIVDPGWAEAFLAASREAAEDVAAIAGKIVSYDGTRADFVEGHMTFDGHGFQRDFRRPMSEVKEPPDGTEMLFACGGNMLVRRSAFLELGGFDDDYFAYLEDVDFGWRAWIAGMRITWAPQAQVRHRSAATSGRLGDFERGVLFERNAAQTVLKNFEDSLVSEAAALPLLAMLHRLHRYTLDRNGDTAPLFRAPFGMEPAKGRSPGIRMRLIRWLLREPDAVVISDPLTRMQFRATEWVFANLPSILEKRRAVQARRRRSDREIFERFPLLAVPTYHRDEELLHSGLFDLLRSPHLRLEHRTLDDMMQR